MNKIDYGHFYQFANSKSNPTITYLVSHFTYVITGLDIATLDVYDDPDIVAFSSNVAGTGDKLCYGSFSQGIVKYLFNFSSKHTSDKVIHYGLHGLEFYSSGFIILLLKSINLIVMIKNSKIINGLVGDSIVSINLETNNISLNFQDQQ